ncbi:MAG: DHH family phosphoesterase [Firmicutes bacterium]|nr:DHH family phosphoesterase [Bacillota bacterium]
MNSKLRLEIARSYLSIDLIAMLVLCVVVLWFNLIAGIICILAVLAIFAFHRYVTEKNVLRKLTEYKAKVLQDREDLMDSFSFGSPLLLCVIDKNYKVQWSNPSFEEIFGGRSDVSEFIPKEELRRFFEDDRTLLKVRLEDRIYSVTGAYASETERDYRMLFFKDVSIEETLKIKYSDSLVCMGYINIDNLDEIIQATPVENRSRVAAEIDEVIFGWAKEMDASVFSMSDSRYAIIFKNKYLPGLEANNFPVLARIRAIETSADFPPSLSIGLGVGEAKLTDLQQTATEALELALGRGGDQAVVRDEKGDTEYYGGNLPSVEKRNKGRSRVMAHALMNLMRDADKVLILGHSRPDMDSIGSSLGIYAMAHNMGKECYIVLENPGDGIESIYQDALRQLDDEGECAYKFLSHAAALEKLSSKTLVVLTDHHRRILSEAPEICDAAKKIAVIDHHRRAADAIENTVLSFTESYASSASELVSEMLQYSGEKGDINRFEADALLAGIALDTKNFTTNTGVRTFEAASWLKRNGADTAVVKDYFKIDLGFYQKKTNVIANAEVLSNGVAVAYTKDVDPAMQLIVSQAADELLTMKGVDAAVASGSNGQTTMVSARSNGRYNMQTLMEKLGGGGHREAAAVQLDVAPEVAISQVVQAMRLEGML